MKKARAEAARVESADRVESPPHHETWIAARTKSDGQMTSKSARVVADKIEGIVEQSTQGSFVSHGRDDILTTAIGRPEHLGATEIYLVHDHRGALLTLVVKRLCREGIVEQSTQGSFVSHGRDDILTTAIGRPEH
uniref:Uncharacterized protein n=1 Tax=Cajanus cajan TaxID=3821 RepID=A0A151QL65_CAJCA|nr:hypothetical protein KK1_049177 [Cajanus cajan]